MMKKQAFSLIELLVVIVVIGVLSGMGISQFKSYAAKANDARRVSHVAAISKAVQLYYAEYESYNFPCAGWHPVGLGPCIQNKSSGYIGVGSDSAVQSSSYTNSIAKFLDDKNYLPTGLYEELTSAENAQNYMYYASDNGYSVSTILERPNKDYAVNGSWYNLEGSWSALSVTDVSRMNQVYNGYGINGVYNRYRRNYAVGSSSE